MYVLPQAEGEPIKLVIPMSLQMGWIKSPVYFCAASETCRDVGKEYAQSKISTLQDFKLLEYAKKISEYKALPDNVADYCPLKLMTEVYPSDSAKQEGYQSHCERNTARNAHRVPCQQDQQRRSYLYW